MKKLLIAIAFAMVLMTSCSSVSVTHYDGSQTILYPDGTMERVF